MNDGSPNLPPRSIPLVVLAGSDPEPAALPAGSGDFHPLRGRKAIALELEGRPIVDVVVERFRACGEFSPIFVAGPREALGEARDGATVIDTDSSFGGNLQAAIEHVQALQPGPMAFTTCDIVPVVDELRELLADYRAHLPLDFWFPVIAAPPAARLGSSAWKPRYRMIPPGSSEAVSILPCHLVIADPGAFRLGLIYRSFQLSYELRNTSVMHRLPRILFGVILYLVRCDLEAVRRFRLPTTTAVVTVNSIVMALKLRGRARLTDLEKLIGRIFLIPSRRREGRRCGGRMPLSTALSLARDIDTREEAQELIGLPERDRGAPSKG